jgi:hypothetical protein
MFAVGYKYSIYESIYTRYYCCMLVIVWHYILVGIYIYIYIYIYILVCIMNDWGFFDYYKKYKDCTGFEAKPFVYFDTSMLVIK